MKLFARLAFLLILPLTVHASSTRQSPHSLIGHPAPHFSLTGLQHERVSMPAFRGKVVLLNFWASWCAPCQAEMPTFQKWQQAYGPARFQVIGISMDDGAPQAAAAVRKLHITYPIALGNARIGDLYGGIYGLPITFLVDRQGRIRARYAGGSDLKAMHTEIDRLLAH